MLRFAACAVAALMLPAAVSAQGAKTPPRTTTITSPVATPKPATSCAEFGPGFVRLEGSGTCVRVGGSVSVGTATSRGLR
jgi:hypothetical protein